MTKQLKSGVETCYLFTKQLTSVVTAFSMVGLGIYSVYQGRAKISLAVGAVALIFAGALAALVGFGILFKTLMRKD